MLNSIRSVLSYLRKLSSNAFCPISIDVEVLTNIKGQPLQNSLKLNGNLKANPEISVADLVRNVKIYDYSMKASQ